MHEIFIFWRRQIWKKIFFETSSVSVASYRILFCFNGFFLSAVVQIFSMECQAKISPELKKENKLVQRRACCANDQGHYVLPTERRWDRKTCERQSDYWSRSRSRKLTLWKNGTNSTELLWAELCLHWSLYQKNDLI